jgi:DNA-directed RNA polymerase subunit M/transcription elongation factor TFIIS
MYYIRIDSEDPNKLIYYCRNCGNEDSNVTSENITVSKTTMKNGEQNFAHIIHKYTKLDPTLPRINTILCPNSSCETNVGEVDRESIYIRYDNTNMKYIYLCAECDFSWKP